MSSKNNKRPFDEPELDTVSEIKEPKNIKEQKGIQKAISNKQNAKCKKQ